MFKNFYQKLKYKNLLFFFLTLVSTFFLINLSPSIFERIQPDSSGYLSGAQYRTMTYSIIVRILANFNVDIIFFQKLLLSTSIISLCFFLKKCKINYFGLIVFYSLIVFNYYYTSFSKTVTPDAIFFSLINFAVINLFYLRSNLNIITFGVLCGMIFTLKPIGMVVTIILCIFSFVAIKNLKKSLTIFFFLLTPILIENLFFYKKFDERSTILKESIIGKLFLLSGKDSFIISKYPIELKDLLNATKNEFSNVHNFLSKVEDRFLRAELMADYEVVAQYQTFNLLSVKKLSLNKNKLKNDYKNIALFLLKNNFYDYITLSLNHYIGIWSIGSKVRYLEEINSKQEIPMYEKLKKSSGKMNLPSSKLLEIVQFFFIILFLILSIKTLIITIKVGFRAKDSISIHDFFYISLSQVYILSICFTNVSTPRYLMTIYPVLIIIFIRFLMESYNKIKRS